MIHGSEVKIIDFAIANWRRNASSTTAAAAVTPRYASPQLMARHKPEAADDVYALACLAYELLTGVHPIDGPAAPAAAFPPPRRPQLNEAQYAAIVNGLQPDRLQRTATVPEFMRQFRLPAPRSAWTRRAAWVVPALALLAAAWWALRPPSPQPVVASPDHGIAAPPSAAASKAPAASATPAPGAAESAALVRDCPTCPLMKVVPPGRFNQGSVKGERDSSSFELPRHVVTIQYPFAMSVNDVTVGDFREFAAATNRAMNGCDVYDGEWVFRQTASWTDPGFVQTALHPVTCVSWNDATAYARWLSMKTSHTYRLPSAAEWEYAARAGAGSLPAVGLERLRRVRTRQRRRSIDGTALSRLRCIPLRRRLCLYGTGRLVQGQRIRPRRHARATCSNGRRIAGIQTMSARLPTDPARMTDPCSEHELRGGSWFSSPAVVQSSRRNHFGADYRTSSVGFRLVRELAP